MTHSVIGGILSGEVVMLHFLFMLALLTYIEFKFENR